MNRHVFSDVDFAASDALHNKKNLNLIDAQVDKENVNADSSTEEFSSSESDDNIPPVMTCSKKSSSKVNVTIEETETPRKRKFLHQHHTKKN